MMTYNILFSLFTVLSLATATIISNVFLKTKTLIDSRYIVRMIIQFFIMISICYLVDKIW